MLTRSRRRPRLAIALMAAGALSCAAWTRSHYHGDTLMYSTPSHRVILGWVPGSLVILDATEDSAGPLRVTTAPGMTIATRFSPTGFSFSGPKWSPSKAFPNVPNHFLFLSSGASIQCATVPPDMTPLAFNPKSGVFLGARMSYVRLPFWLLAFPPLALGALLLPARRQRLPNHCPTCNYDLRASPDRCPECGTAAIPAAQ